MTHEARSLWLSSRSFGPVPAVRLPSPNYRPLLFLSNISSRVAECTVPVAVSSVESRPVAPRSRRRSLFLARSPPETFNHREKEAEDPRQNRWRCCSYAAWRSASSTTRGTGDFFFFLSLFFVVKLFVEILFVRFLLLLNVANYDTRIISNLSSRETELRAIVNN